MKKVLVLSLLRLGDLLLQEEIFQAIKAENPESELHVLIHEQFSHGAGLLPVVDRWHSFPHRLLQTQLVEFQKSNILAPFLQLKTFVQNLNEQKFDKVINLSHTSLSARLMELLSAPEKRGVQFARRDPSPWERYFNDVFSQTERPAFHWTDILARTIGHTLSTADRISNKNRTIANILFQPLTSAADKNWPLTQWRELYLAVKAQYPDACISILCAPFERDQLLEHFQSDTLLCTDLLEAKRALEKADLLVSGDTSILHLAASCGAPVVSIFVNGKNLFKTFPRQVGALIVAAESPQQISAKDVLQVVVQREAARFQERSLARFYTVAQVENFYCLQQLGGTMRDEQNFQNSMNRLAWSFYLNQEFEQALPPYSSYCRFHLTESNRRKDKFGSLCKDYRTVLAKQSQALTRVQAILTEVSRAVLQQGTLGPQAGFADLSDLKVAIYGIMTECEPLADDFQILKHALGTAYDSSFSLYRRLKAGYEEALTLHLIRTKAVEVLERESMNGELSYGRKDRELS